MSTKHDRLKRRQYKDLPNLLRAFQFQSHNPNSDKEFLVKLFASRITRYFKTSPSANPSEERI